MADKVTASFTWWRRNKPKDLDDFGIGDLLKDVSSFNMKNLPKDFSELVMDAISHRKSEIAASAEMTKVRKIFQDCHAKLKTFERIVAKSGQHDRFAKDLLKVMEIVKDKQKTVELETKLAVERMNHGVRAVAKSTEDIKNEIGNFLKSYEATVEELRSAAETERKKIDDLAKSIAKKEKPSVKTVSELVSSNRRVMMDAAGQKTKAKDLISAATESVRDARTQLLPSGSRNENEGFVKEIMQSAPLLKVALEAEKSIGAIAKENEKKLAGLCIEAFGKSEGMKIFMDAKPKAAAKSDTVALKIKPQQAIKV